MTFCHSIFSSKHCDSVTLHLHCRLKGFNHSTTGLVLTAVSCGSRSRTYDLKVMSLASYHCSIPLFPGWYCAHTQAFWGVETASIATLAVSIKLP